MPLRPPARAALVLLASLALASPIAGAQRLVLTVDALQAALDDAPRSLRVPARVVQGRAVVPLLDTLTLLGLPALPVNDVPIEESGAVTLGGQVYVDPRWLASTSGATLDVSADGRRLTFTAPRAALDPAAPRARFTTDRVEYRPGEKVTFTDASSDPSGATIVKREWTNRQDAYFQPGEHAVSLRVTNAGGKVSAPYTAVVRVAGLPIATPLGFALANTAVGATFPDPLIVDYPSLNARVEAPEAFPLLFSDSPEKPRSPGVLYRDAVSGRARLLGYHVNALGVPARLFIVARNLEARPVRITRTRAGAVAPSNIEGTLGQGALLDYFASSPEAPIEVPPGGSVPLYASPTLANGYGASVMHDIETDGRVEVSFAILEGGQEATPEALAALRVLPPDGVHHRGTFPGAVRRLSVTLDRLPARLNLGDGDSDASLEGVDALTGKPVRLAGNYGVLYEVEVRGAANAVVALSPRAGAYRGALQVEDGARASTLRVPNSGVLSRAESPLLLWRAENDRLNLRFVPANGSHLPVSLVFYRPR